MATADPLECARQKFDVPVRGGVYVFNPRTQGTYHRAPVIHYLAPSTGLNVMTDPEGNFISGWSLSAEQLQNVLAHGGL